MVDGAPEWDGWVFDPRRYTGYATTAYTVAKAVELYQNEYAVGFPFEERPAGRPARTTPLYPVLAAKGARFAARNGWERAAFFDPEGTVAEPTLSLRRERNWNELVAAEVQAVREAVGVIDLGGFSKFMLEGPGAAAMLDRLLCSRLPKPGRIGLCYALDAKGGVVSEFTVTRLAEDRFYLVSASTAEWHDEDLLRAALPAGRLGAARAVCMAGSARWSSPARPRGRCCGQVTPADLSNAAFPWLSAREIELGFGRALALRVNYVGELGWELHLPMEQLSAGLRGGHGRRCRARHPRRRHLRRRIDAPRQVLPQLEAGSGDRLLRLRGRPRPLRRPHQARFRRQGGAAGRARARRAPAPGAR